MKNKNLPFYTKIAASASVFLFVAAMVISIIIQGNYNVLAGNYNKLFSEQRNLEESINEKNNNYFADLLTYGIAKIDGGKKTIYSVIEKYYKYKLFINDVLITNQSSFPITKSYCVIRFEEYYTADAQNNLPLSILREFSYFRNKGNGGEKISTADIFNGEDMEYKCPDYFLLNLGTDDTTYPFKTVITIEVSEMTAGSGIELFFNNFNFSKKFDMENFSLSINCISV